MGLLALAVASVLGAQEGATGARAAALERARQTLQDAAESVDEDEAFCLLLAASRCYYDDRAGALSVAERSALRDAVLADLGEAADAMDPDAMEQTVAELMRRRLREHDPVLDPDRLEGLAP